MGKAFMNVNIAKLLVISSLTWIKGKCVSFWMSAHAIQSCSKAFAIVKHKDGQEHNATWHSECCVECMGVQ